MKTYEWVLTQNRPGQWKPKYNPDASFSHLCTYGNQHEIYDAVQEKLDSAKESVSIINFLITHDGLISRVISARKVKKLRVRVMTWLDQMKHLYIEEENIYRFFRSQAKSWRKLALNDVPLRSNTKCHIKMMVIDKATAIISSANLTNTSLTRNPENGILIAGMEDEIEIIQNFARLIWNDYANTEIASLPPHVTACFQEDNTDEYLRVQSRATRHDPAMLDGLSQETDNFRFLFTGPCYNTLYDFIKEMLERAEGEILLLSYKICNIRQMGLLRILEGKIRSGTTVRVLVCKKDTKILGVYGKLLEIGCKVEAIEYNHAKGIVVDQKEVMIMTANIDNYIMPDKGSINMGIYFKNKEYANQAKEFINFLFENSSHTLRAK